MSTKAQRFGDIRALLQRPPSQETWLELLTRFEQSPLKEQEYELLPYAREHLKVWPDELKTWQKSWTKRFFKGHRMPVLGLLNTLSFHNKNLAQKPIAALKAHQDYMRIERLVIDHESNLTSRWLRQFLQLPIFEPMTHFRWSNCDIDKRDRGWVRVFRDLRSPNIQSLWCFKTVPFEVTLLEEILSGQRLEKLKTFGMGEVDTRHRPLLKQFKATHIQHIGLSFAFDNHIANFWTNDPPWMDHIESLTVGYSANQTNEAHLEGFLRGARFGNLKHLSLEGYLWHGAALMSAAIENPTLQHLETIDILLPWSAKHTNLGEVLAHTQISDQLKNYLSQQQHRYRQP